MAGSLHFLIKYTPKNKYSVALFIAYIKQKSTPVVRLT